MSIDFPSSVDTCRNYRQIDIGRDAINKQSLIEHNKTLRFNAIKDFYHFICWLLSPHGPGWTTYTCNNNTQRAEIWDIFVLSKPYFM